MKELANKMISVNLVLLINNVSVELILMMNAIHKLKIIAFNQVYVFGRLMFALENTAKI